MDHLLEKVNGEPYYGQITLKELDTAKKKGKEFICNVISSINNHRNIEINVTHNGHFSLVYLLGITIHRDN